MDAYDLVQRLYDGRIDFNRIPIHIHNIIDQNSLVKNLHLMTLKPGIHYAIPTGLHLHINGYDIPDHYLKVIIRDCLEKMNSIKLCAAGIDRGCLKVSIGAVAPSTLDAYSRESLDNRGINPTIAMNRKLYLWGANFIAKNGSVNRFLKIEYSDHYVLNNKYLYHPKLIELIGE